MVNYQEVHNTIGRVYFDLQKKLEDAIGNRDFQRDKLVYDIKTNFRNAIAINNWHSAIILAMYWNSQEINNET